MGNETSFETLPEELFRETLRRSASAGAPAGELLIPGNAGHWRQCLQRVDLASGESLTKIFSNTGHGHSVTVSPAAGRGWLIPENGRLILQFSTGSLATERLIEVPGGMAGGHGCCSADGRRLYFVCRSVSGDLESDLVVYDADAGKELYRVPGVGIFAHDVLVTADERTAVAASYGAVVDFYGDAWSRALPAEALSVFRPSFAVVDLGARRVAAKKEFPPDFALAHIVFDPKEEAAFIQGTRGMALNGCPEARLLEVTSRRGFGLTEEEKLRGRVYLHGEQLKVRLRDLGVESLPGLRHCRSQSIVFAAAARKLYGSYAVSRKVVAVDPDAFRIISETDSSACGLTDPRGLALTPDGRLLVVTGRQAGIFFMDTAGDRFLPELTLNSRNRFNAHVALAA